MSEEEAVAMPEVVAGSSVAEAEVESANAAASAAAPPRSKKGYYYWHGHEKERAKVGDVAPMPKPMKVDAPACENFDAVASTRVLPITGYSWCNNSKTVSVYVNFPEVGLMEDKVSVKFQTNRTTVEVVKGSNVHSLVLHLSHPIDAEASSFRLKPDQVVLKLNKGNVSKTWIDLTGKPVVDASDDE